jgi:DNA-binding LacI/PurR family transcriptional regulator
MSDKFAEVAPRKRSTIADVAALAGVSRGAVSQVFNGTGKISDGTTARIREAATSLNWTPSKTAVALRRSRSHTIGLVLKRPRELDIATTGALLIAGMESALAPRNYGLLLHHISRDPEVEQRTYRELASNQRVDGVILSDSRVDDKRFDLARSLGIPAVLIGTPSNDDPIPHIDSDPPGAGVDDAVHHLADLGHRRIAYVGGEPDRMQAVLRRQMFERTMALIGIKPVAVINGNYSAASGAEHTAKLLQLASPPTAIIYGTDPMAMGGMSAARRRNVRIPEMLSIVGFDGLPVGEWLDPALTTVQRDHAQRGHAVAIHLLRILGESVPPEDTLRRPHMIFRGSTAEPPSVL